MQAAVIRKAYQNAGLSFSDTDYVECHGTGTPVGDPIEVDGIAACFAGREGEPLRIGSVRFLSAHLLTSYTDEQLSRSKQTWATVKQPVV